VSHAHRAVRAARDRVPPRRAGCQSRDRRAGDGAVEETRRMSSLGLTFVSLTKPSRCPATRRTLLPSDAAGRPGPGGAMRFRSAGRTRWSRTASHVPAMQGPRRRGPGRARCGRHAPRTWRSLFSLRRQVPARQARPRDGTGKSPRPVADGLDSSRSATAVLLGCLVAKVAASTPRRTGCSASGYMPGMTSGSADERTLPVCRHPNTSADFAMILACHLGTSTLFR
jgi:hypothetical protein